MSVGQNGAMAFPTQPAPVIDEPMRPSAAWFWIGGGLIALAVAGAIAGFVFALTGLDDTIDGFERVPYPDGGSVLIAEAGDYVVYAEETSSFIGPDRSAQIVITGPGGPVDSSLYLSELTYDFGGRSGLAMATFTADIPGRYEFAPSDDEFSDITSLAVGDSIADDLVKAILLPMALGGLGFILGGVILIVTGVRRSREKKRRQPAGPPVAPGGWGAGQQTWGPQPQQPQPQWGQPAAPAPTQPNWGQPSPPTTPSPPPSPGATPPPPPGWPE
jgi:hypothetical protein